MAREDVVVHEEEDLGTAMQKLVVPLNELDELDPLPTDSVYGFIDEVKEILEDSNVLLEDSREFDDPINDLGVFQNSSNLPTTIRSRFHVPKRSRNRIGRRKRRCFKSSAYLFDTTTTNKSCSHCRTTKTPLWREGPKGPGTLCNACGMRYRTGRLLPEYRPALSPDFKPNVHSNFHRKVVEIRRERNSLPNSFGSEGFRH
ncbi:GATA transcription factor 14 [Cardamine amara subsp. amara]|uniref:GATA transcription factor 14 n=1 Tax=Cardamine amara subsp. amara TaxID=228776 RepID=A0ABD1B2C8_CARAN